MSASLKSLKVKAAKFCAYRERAASEVRQKLMKIGASEEEAEEVLSILVKENFLNEDRFGRAFALDKFRFNKWGKIKIRHALVRLQLDNLTIEKSLDCIEKEEYSRLIEQLASKKYSSLEGKANAKPKTVNYLMQKGFEYDEIKKCMSSLS